MQTVSLQNTRLNVSYGHKQNTLLNSCRVCFLLKCTNYLLSSRIDNMGRDKSINLRRFALDQILFHHHRSKKERFEETQKKIHKYVE